MQNNPTADPVVNRVIARYQHRIARGQQKYGMTLNTNPAEMVDRLRHIQEELMDGAAYCEWAIGEVHRLRSKDLGRRVEVEQELLDMASGRRNFPLPEDLHRMAMKLGVPEGVRDGE